MIQAAYTEIGAATAMKPNRKDAVVLIPSPLARHRQIPASWGLAGTAVLTRQLRTERKTMAGRHCAQS
jgi:hypothetical protein